MAYVLWLLSLALGAGGAVEFLRGYRQCSLSIQVASGSRASLDGMVHTEIELWTVMSRPQRRRAQYEIIEGVSKLRRAGLFFFAAGLISSVSWLLRLEEAAMLEYTHRVF